jgi:hypothetical protein
VRQSGIPRLVSQFEIGPDEPAEPADLRAVRAAAIVSEPFRPLLPVPMVSGSHLVTFTEPEQCADACERLLDHPDEVQALREGGWTYYRDEVRPDALMRNRLADLAAFS